MMNSSAILRVRTARALLLLSAAAIASASGACGATEYCVYNMALPCPHAGACHGAPSTPCDCNGTPDPNACASCSPSPTPPTPTPPPAPVPPPAPPATIAAEKAALRSLYAASSGAAWRNRVNWTVNEDHCTWFGVECSSATGRVVSFSLYDNLLIGTIPSGLSALAAVQYFALSTNKLSGTVPADLGATFGDVRYFDLNYNLLSGSIPSGVRNMSRVNHLVLSNNHFHGSIASLAPLRALEYLDTAANRLTGAIPATLCDNAELRFCSLGSPKVSFF